MIAIIRFLLKHAWRLGHESANMQNKLCQKNVRETLLFKMNYSEIKMDKKLRTGKKKPKKKNQEVKHALNAKQKAFKIISAEGTFSTTDSVYENQRPISRLTSLISTTRSLSIMQSVDKLLKGTLSLSFD